MSTDSKKNYGSFQDSLKSPIHRWFTYPAGYSHKFVEAKISENALAPGSCVADPFLGTGTTSIAARSLGMDSVGIEAHPFVYWVAKTKMHFNHDVDELARDSGSVMEKAASIAGSIDSSGVWPELVYKCFSKQNLVRLYALRTAILELETDESRKSFLKLALTSTLRIVTSAGAGWPYIAPSKHAGRTVVRDAFVEFGKHCALMISDLQHIQSLNIPYSRHNLVMGDARKFAEHADRESVDLIITSPPYLNNYDYADRTRLETYFWGIYNSWGDITREVRDHLIIAATTQIRITAMSSASRCPNIEKIDPVLHKEITAIIESLSQLRKTRAGKKTYDLMVAGYFEDMLKVIQGAYQVLKPGRQFVFVLGDSAPYGVHVPTDEIVGRLAQSVGFSRYEIEELRSRGGKWANNSQRHKVPLRESVLTVVK